MWNKFMNTPIVDILDVVGGISMFIVSSVLLVCGCVLLTNDNLVGFVMIAAGLGIADQYIGTKACPQCRTNIHHKATMCKHCHSMQDPEEQ